MEVLYNAQLTPYLEVESEAGKEIVITTENTAQGSVFATYITKEGRQSFESPGWMNGERITYRIPKGVKIISLKYPGIGLQHRIQRQLYLQRRVPEYIMDEIAAYPLHYHAR